MNLDDIKKLHEQLKNDSENKGNGGGGDKTYISLEQGQNHVRILPGKEDALQFFVKTAVHKYQDAENKYQSFTCRKTENEACPICDLYFDLWKEHKALDLGNGPDGKQLKSKQGNLATSLKPKVRYYLNVLDKRVVEAKKDENPVKILVAIDKLFTDIVGEIANDDYMDENGNSPLSLEHGNDFILELSKNEGGFLQFKGRARPKKTAAGSKQDIAKYMESLHDLKKFVVIGDYEEGKKIVENLRATLSTIDSKTSATKTTNENSGEVSTEEYLNKLKG